MSKNLGRLILAITFISVIVLMIVSSDIVLEEKEPENSDDPGQNIIDKSNNPKVNIVGSYKIKDDKSSMLTIDDNGDYELHINVCEGYLKLTGKYETADKKLKLFNEKSFEQYPSLDKNYEFSFTIIDNDTIRLDEDLVCLFQNTLFER